MFDEAKRKEFLTGFHKRKLQRKKEAKEKFEQELKDERKRLKAEAKESYKKLVVSHRPIPELEDLLEDKYEDEDVTVKVVELSTNEIAQQNHWIGSNQPNYEPSSEEEEDDDDNEEQAEEMPGMELKAKKVKAEPKEEVKKVFNTEKDIKRTLKKQATKNVKKSKVFQMKNKMEKQKQKKKSLRLKKEKQKILNKSSKGIKHKKSKH